jgi:hypothetical protein
LAYIGTKPTIGNFQICDAISVVNGQAAYTMQVGSVNVSPQSANHMIVSLNGTIQKPNSSFTVSGSTITFASNLATGDVIDFIQILGDVLDLGVPSDATVTNAKLADSSVSLAKLTATGTKDATTFLRGDNTFSTIAGGLTMVDQWRLTSSFSVSGNGTTDITSNLERIDTNSPGFIGNPMTESSGVFSFPSTGIYEITSIGNVFSSNNLGYLRLNHMVTSDNGSSYNNQAEFNGHTHTNYYYSTTAVSLFDVLDVSTHKIKFQMRHPNDASLQGNTATTMTTFFFKKLGDT